MVTNLNKDKPDSKIVNMNEDIMTNIKSKLNTKGVVPKTVRANEKK